MRTDSGIQQRQDLKGKRVGVPEYQQTVEWRADVGRMLELVIDGLRYGAPDRRHQPVH